MFNTSVKFEILLDEFKHTIIFCFRVNGLFSIIITDRDGVPLVRAVTERAPELALRPNFISTFGMATDQASKLGLGRNKTIISMYSSYQVRHVYFLLRLKLLLCLSTCFTTNLLLSDILDTISYNT